MRLKIKGKADKNDIIEAVATLLNTLEEMGVDSFGGVNLYVNPYIGRERVVPLSDDGEFDCEVIPTSKLQRLKAENLSGNVVMLKPEGEDRHEPDLGRQYRFAQYVTLEPAKKLKALGKALETKRQEELERIREEERREALRYREAQEERDRQDARLAKHAKAQVIEILGIGGDEFDELKSSISWIVSSRAMRKYTDQDLGSRALRIALNTGIKGEKDVFLFSENGTFKARCLTKNGVPILKQT